MLRNSSECGRKYCHLTQSVASLIQTACQLRGMPVLTYHQSSWNVCPCKMNCGLMPHNLSLAVGKITVVADFWDPEWERECELLQVVTGTQGANVTVHPTSPICQMRKPPANTTMSVALHRKIPVLSASVLYVTVIVSNIYAHFLCTRSHYQ